jgi:hypothetical protein
MHARRVCGLGGQADTITSARRKGCVPYGGTWALTRAPMPLATQHSTIGLWCSYGAALLQEWFCSPDPSCDRETGFDQIKLEVALPPAAQLPVTVWPTVASPPTKQGVLELISWT